MSDATAMASEADQPSWFYIDSASNQQGPCTWTELVGLCTSGTVAQTSLAWSQGWPDWTPLSTLMQPRSSDVTDRQACPGSSHAGQHEEGDAAPSNEGHRETSTSTGSAPSGNPNRDEDVVPRSTINSAVAAAATVEDEELRRFAEEVQKAEAEAEAAKRGRKKSRVVVQEISAVTSASGGTREGKAAEKEPEADEEREGERENPGDMEGVAEGGTGARAAASTDAANVIIQPRSQPQGDSGPTEGEEFEDDDGTRYRWSSQRGVWVPLGEDAPLSMDAATPGASLSSSAAGPSGSENNSKQPTSETQPPPFDPTMMTFEGEDDVMPSLAEAIAASARPAASSDEDVEGGKGRGRKGKAEGKGKKGKGEKVHWGQMEQPESTGTGPGRKGAQGEEANGEGAHAEVSGKKGKGANVGKGEEKQPGANQPEGWFELKVNTSVYVTGLPGDVTVDEVVEVFSKCGVIKEDLETGKARVKLYQDRESGLLKGDGLVTFLKEPSVALAAKVLDGTALRLGDQQPMTVTVAKFEQKGDAFVKKRKAADDKRKKMMRKLEQKALGWGGFDDSKVTLPVTVILKQMFTRDELVADPSLPGELEADVMAECSKWGPVERVKVYPNHPEGVVSVRYKDRNDGRKCIETMNGRWFGGRKVEAFEDTGLVKWGQVRDEDEEARRLELFGSELEADE